MKKSVHIFFVSVFCIVCFFGGRFVYDFFIFEGTPSFEYFEGINTKKVQQQLSIDKSTVDSGIILSEQQDDTSLTVVEMPEGMKLGNQEGWNIFLKDITLTYNSDSRTVSGKYSIENFDERSIDSMYTQLILVIPREDPEYPPMYFDSVTTEVFSLTAKTQIQKEFSYPVREGLAGKGAYFLIELHMGGGDMITFVQSPTFDISGNLKVLALRKPRVIDTLGVEYGIGDGPTLYPDTGIFKISYRLINDSKASIGVTPTLDIYKLVDKKDAKISTVSGKPLVVGPGESEIHYFDLPDMDFVPGVYIGKLLFLDEKGVNLGLDVPVRWIIGGDVARIANLVNYKPYAPTGNVIVDIEYTGTPPSINPSPTNDSVNTKSATIYFTLQEEDGAALGETHTFQIPIYIGQKIGTQRFKFPVGKYSDDPYIKVSIQGDGGILLDEKTFSLKNSLIHQDIQYYSIYWIILVFGIIVAAFFFLVGKIIDKKFLWFIIFASIFSTIIQPQTAEAYVAGCEEAGINISGPSAANTFVCGQSYTFTGGWWMNACMNTDAAMYVDGNLVDYNNGWGCVKPPCELVIPKSGSFAVNRGMPANYRGYYVVRIGWNKSQGDCSNSGTASYGINVTCCGGPIPQNATKCPNTEANTTNRPVLNCTGAKVCEYDCAGGYIPDTPNSIHCRLPICLANPAIGAGSNNVGPANSYVLSGAELPGSLQLTQDYYTTLRWSIGPTQHTLAEIDRSGTAAGCEYTCNPGYIPDGASSCRLPICRANGAVGVTADNTPPTNASPLTTNELPSSLTLVRDYSTTIIADPTKRVELNTPDGCQYSCNDGFKIGPKTATAESNTAGTFAKITHGGGGYTTAPSVQVTGGSCTTLPTATTTINVSGSIDSLTLTGAVNCTAAPTLTISAPTDTVIRCTPISCLGFAKPIDATYCAGDTTLAGHKDELNTRRADSTGCTSNQKCEWYCPADKPFYCEVQNQCATSQNECGQTNTCKTSAPSELKTAVDYPLIQCDAIDQTNTHFRYKITKTGGTTADTYTSPLYTIGTSVKHPTTLFAGTYTVTCLYGTSASTNAATTDYGMTAGTCTKTMTVNDTANGCSRIYPYRGATLSDEMSSSSAFDASFRCGSRQAVNNVIDTKAYRLQVGTGDAAYLAFDRNISDLFAGLAIGPVSTQTQNYNFSTGALVSCAAKVGDGYSTNNSCHITTCVGGNCANPQTFIVVPSEEITCTNQDSTSYDVGCNPSSPDYNSCLQFLYEGTGANGNTTYTRNVRIKVNGVEQDRYFTCKTETPPGALGPVKTCTISLNNGSDPVTIFAGDAQGSNNYSFQTTAYTIKKDTGKPVGTIAYYTNYSNGVTLSQDQYEYWQRQPITAVITCTDKTSTNQPGEQDGSGCACARTLTTNNATPTPVEQAEIDQWSLGIPSSNTNIGPDVMTYSRVITNNNGALTSVKVQDSANNKSDQTFTPDFGIDSMPPKLFATESGSSVTLAFTDNHLGASGFWKPASAFNEALPAGVLRGTTTGNNAILYRTGPKSSLASLEFGADCSPLPVKNTNYYKYKEVPSAPTTQTLTLNSFDVNNNVVAYCIQDNAGNINRGYYPNNVTGCFASSNMATVPTLSPSTLSTHYAPLLKTRITSTLSNNEKYGYSFSENTLNASCFRGILSNNVTTLVSNQLTPRTTLTLTNWDTDRAVLKNTTTLNTNGYYYYSYTSTTANTLTLASTPTGTGTKSVIVEGGNIQINTNIEYTGTGKTLLLVARKNSAGQGGNIYINPSVTRVDAIIIADGGAVMNGVTTNGVTTTKEWITHPTELTNRLTINGRIYSYNTRGGSVTPQAAPGTDFDPITGNIGKLFNGSTFNASASPTQAATYDLERLRVMLSDGNSQCTTHVNYQVFTIASLPRLLMRPAYYEGGNCTF